ncbi:MAG: hypothetical protein ACT4PZ_21700 [Panacagrimonas sp.]
MTHGIRALLVLGSLTLAACESSFDAEIVVNPLPPSNQARLTATVRIEGIDLQTTSDQTRQVNRNQVLELLSTPNDLTPTPVDLISNASIGDGEYESLRLRLATDEGSVTSSGTTIPVPRRSIESGTATSAFSPVAFLFEDGEDNVALTIALDLPLSLSLNDDEDGYVLNPVVRAMERGDAATIQGTVPALRLNNDDDCLSGASVYAFAGADITPDERDGQGVEPIATALVTRTTNPPSYTLPFLVPGTYSLALTCDGELENGLEEADSAMVFTAGPEDLDLSADEILQANFQP